MLIKIKVTTGARSEKIVKKSADSYSVSVKEEAERNMANKRVIEIIRKLHPNKSVKIVKGHHSPSKIIEIK
jgi:uncharacterized protein YggU (UPF0235/DUF167 family)